MLRVQDKAWSDLVYWRVMHEWSMRVGYFWGAPDDPRFSFAKVLSTIRRARRVLSVGCGTGTIEFFLPSNIDVVGVDSELARIKAAWGLCPWTMFMLGDGVRLPYRDAAFDLVLACSVIEFVGDKQRFVDEARRVLVDGGELLLATPNAEHPDFVARRADKMVAAEVEALLGGFDYVKWKVVTWSNGEDDRFLFYEAVKKK